jgi:hypothetical protein
MLADFDRRQFNGHRPKEEAAQYYLESGILAFLVDLESRGFTQHEMCEQLLEAGYRNFTGKASFTQPLVARVLRRARELGQIPAPTT